jgi:hypothetical protein
MNKRPKSREETPKEGSDSARRYRTATICGRAAQNASGFRFISHALSAGLADLQHRAEVDFCCSISISSQRNELLMLVFDRSLSIS